VTWTFDEEETLDAFARAGILHMFGGQLTMYAVTCVGNGEEPHYSHGGVLFLTSVQALAFARQCNELADEADDNECHYMPSAVSVEPAQLIELLGVMDDPFEEQEDED
jgi:hypothetical protein